MVIPLILPGGSCCPLCGTEPFHVQKEDPETKEQLYAYSCKCEECFVILPEKKDVIGFSLDVKELETRWSEAVRSASFHSRRTYGVLFS